jgi:SnoaL-like domain
MPKRETIEEFVALVEAGAFDTAMERFYAEDASMQENQEPPRQGLKALIEGERRTMARSRNIIARCVRPILVEGDTVAIRWHFEFEFNDGGTIVLDEITHQRWVGEKMRDEKFFYDPKQMGR